MQGATKAASTVAVVPTPNPRSQSASRGGTKTPHWQEQIGARAHEEMPIGGKMLREGEERVLEQ